MFILNYFLLLGNLEEKRRVKALHTSN